MNGWLLVSLESGLLINSKSHFGENFGMQSLGSNHMQLSSTIFAFYKLTCNTVVLRRNQNCSNDTILKQNHKGDQNENGLEKAVLHWLKFGDVYLHLQEVLLNKTKINEENNTNDRILVILVSPNNDNNETGNQELKKVETLSQGQDRLFSNIQLKLQDHVAQYKQDDRPADSYNANWTRNVDDIIMNEIVNACSIQKKFFRVDSLKAPKSISAIENDYYNALCAEEALNNDQHLSESNEVITDNGWLSFISQIPMRLISALSKSRKETEKK
jgi:hypothetical protein